MSTLFSNAASVPPIRRDQPAIGAHQSNSWRVRLSTLLSWAQRRRQRNTLIARIDDKRMLSDVGLTRDQVLLEAAKPFWR